MTYKSLWSPYSRVLYNELGFKDLQTPIAYFSKINYNKRAIVVVLFTTSQTLNLKKKSLKEATFFSKYILFESFLETIFFNNFI